MLNATWGFSNRNQGVGVQTPFARRMAADAEAARSISSVHPWYADSQQPTTTEAAFLCCLVVVGPRPGLTKRYKKTGDTQNI